MSSIYDYINSKDKRYLRKYQNIDKALQNDYSIKIFNRQFDLLEASERYKIYRYQEDLRNPIWAYIYIDGILTMYSISILGDVRNNTTGGILKPKRNRYGYYTYNLPVPYPEKQRLRTLSIHRLVAQAFIPNPENKPQVNHINGDKSFNWAGNLEWTTSKENIDHAINTGLRNNAGVNNNTNKYDEAMIHTICRLLESGNQPIEIARSLNIPSHTVQQIKSGQNWKSISKDYNIPRPINLNKGKEFHDAVVELIMAGYSNTEIAEYMGLPMDNPIKSREYIGLFRRRLSKQDQL